ncbi:hypothetical protein RUM44_013265 [Polyplax serrata]|uniref:Methyltransferase-like 26 n=1 Tax=Polyplax serrata TaxID=468196 RepID=A0ABR1BDN8_POLSC
MFVKSEAPAAERNKTPILEVLKTIIKAPKGQDFADVKILEISSGTGQHIAHFAKNLHPQIFWQPSDYDRSHFSSICAYIEENKLSNVAPPVFVDIREDYTKWRPICGEEEKRVSKLHPITDYKEYSFNYIYNSNLIHIASFDCAVGLFYNSGKLLKKGGYLITYGPYGQNGVISPESNVQFDKSLKLSNPSWGVRDIQLQLIPLAEKNGLKLKQIIDMPSNNKTLIWEKL